VRHKGVGGKLESPLGEGQRPLRKPDPLKNVKPEGDEAGQMEYDPARKK